MRSFGKRERARSAKASAFVNSRANRASTIGACSSPLKRPFRTTRAPWRGPEGRASAMARDGEQPIRRLSNVRHNICRIVNRCGSILFPRFELFDECGEMRGNGSREGVILVFEALPNC
jgi:hypothetical protein